MTLRYPSCLTRLDLTGEASLPPDAARQLDAIALELRRPYVALIESLSIPFEGNIDWWVTPLASRNTYVCPLFRRLCQLELARRWAVGRVGCEIRVESPALASLLRGQLPQAIRVTSVLGPIRWYLHRIFTIAWRTASVLYSCSARFLSSIILANSRQALPQTPIILVDTFIYRNSIQGGRLVDRHYPGLVDQLTEDERARVYWAPIPYQVRNFFRLGKLVRACGDNVLMAEEFLKARDYAYACVHLFRAPRKLPDCEFQGIPVEVLVHEAYAEAFGGSGSIEGLLRYRFAMRLREAGIRLERVIEWFENQEVDHGAIAGWRTFHPETPVFGYQGFLASCNYLSTLPTETERSFGLLPHKLAVMGPYLVERVREFCPELEVTIAPAFRFSALWRDSTRGACGTDVVLLVSLPLDATETRRILEMVGIVMKEDPYKSWQVQIKPHPAFSRGDLKSAAGLFPSWAVVDGDLDEWLERADVFVGSASSACVQAVVHGVPTAVIGSQTRPTLNTIPDWVDDTLWTVCYTAEELRIMLGSFAQRNDASRAWRRELGAGIRERLFSPVTRPAVMEFLGLPQTELAANSPLSI